MKHEHELKLLTEYYNRILMGQKTFEIRRNDRDFQVGDVLVLREFSGEEYLDSQPIRAEVTYITNYEQKPDYVVMGFIIQEVKDE